MSNDIYEPPSSNLSDGQPPQVSSLRAISFAVIVDIGGTFIFTFLFAIVYTVIMLSLGSTPEAVQETFAALQPFSGMGIVLSFCGLLITVFASGLCTKRNLQFSVRNTWILSAIMVGYSFSMGFGHYEMGENAFLSAVTLMAVIAGHKLALKKYGTPTGRSSDGSTVDF